MTHLDEQETVIQFDPIDDVVHFFSTMPSVIRKYRKLAEKNDISPVRDEEDLIEIDIPKNLFQFTVRKKRKLTEEERIASSERLKAYNFKRREDAHSA